MAGYIKLRSDGRYRLNLRVPTDLVSVVGRKVMDEALHTSDKGEALVKARAMVEQYRRGWSDVRDGKDENAQGRFEAARRIARRHGLPYRHDIDEGARLNELLRRANALAQADEPGERAALSGGVTPAVMKVSDLVEAVESLKRVELSRKSDRQKHRWQLARKRAVKNFVAVIGDRDINGIARDDALDFRDWWAQRLIDESLSADSPNKDFQHLGTMLRTVAEARRIETGDPFAGLRFSETAPVQPHAITRGELRHVFDQIGRLGPAPAAIVEVLVQTGMRPTEAVNAATYHVDADIPHIVIGGDRLKTKNANRRIPLTGRALEAVRQRPDAFATYADREASLCAWVGKWLRSVFPDLTKISAYSFRHGFQDRLIEAGVQERIQADLMGHAIERARYGAGPSLAQLSEVMECIRVD